MSLQEYRPSQFKMLPDVVKNLLIINGLFYLATYVLENKFGIDLVEMLGLHYIGSDKFRPYQIVTHLFMHGSFGHVFSNMFMLWMFGNVLENYWGGKRFLIYYLVTGFGAAFMHYMVSYFYDVQPVLSAINDYIAAPSASALESFVMTHRFNISFYAPEAVKSYFHEFQYYAGQLSTNPADSVALQKTVDFMAYYKNYFLGMSNMVGASGAVFGVLLAYGMLFPNQLIYLYFLIPIKAKYFVLMYGLFELWNGLSNDAADNVAHFAHLGGMLFGFVLIKYWNRNDRQNFY